MCQQLSQGLSLLSSNDDFLTDTPRQVSHVVLVVLSEYAQNLTVWGQQTVVREPNSEVCEQLMGTHKMFPISELIFLEVAVCMCCI
jgi:hypothetical protein